MAGKKKKDMNNPLSGEAEQQVTEQSSTITYANDVIAIIAGLAASEVEGVAGMCNVSGGLLGKNRNNTRGVRVEVGTEEVSVDLYVTVDYGTPIQRAAHDCQEGVKRAIESMTGLHVVRVDVHVLGVSFEKEMKALQAGASKAVLEAGEISRPALKGRKDGAAQEDQAQQTDAGGADGEKTEPQSVPVEISFGEDEEIEILPDEEEPAPTGDQAVQK